MSEGYVTIIWERFGTRNEKLFIKHKLHDLLKDVEHFLIYTKKFFFGTGENFQSFRNVLKPCAEFRSPVSKLAKKKNQLYLVILPNSFLCYIVVNVPGSSVGKSFLSQQLMTTCRNELGLSIVLIDCLIYTDGN